MIVLATLSDRVGSYCGACSFGDTARVAGVDLWLKQTGKSWEQVEIVWWKGSAVRIREA
jgi:hypothetical protein